MASVSKAVVVGADAGAYSLADVPTGCCVCFSSCADEQLSLLLLERGLSAGVPLRLCWRARLGGALCIEAAQMRLVLRRKEAGAISVIHG